MTRMIFCTIHIKITAKKIKTPQIIFNSFLFFFVSFILYTPKKTMHLKVISAYAVKAQDQMPITFANEMQKKEYITKIRRMSEPSIKLDDKKIIFNSFLFFFVSFIFFILI